MAILKSGRKELRASLIAGILSYTNCFAPHENPYPERPWYDSMCGDFHRRLVYYKEVDFDSLQTLLERCEEECPKATEGESLRFCADIFCCRYASQECSYTGKEPDRFSESSAYYEVCMSNYKIEPLRAPQ